MKVWPFNRKAVTPVRRLRKDPSRIHRIAKQNPKAAKTADDIAWIAARVLR